MTKHLSRSLDSVIIEASLGYSRMFGRHQTTPNGNDERQDGSDDYRLVS